MYVLQVFEVLRSREATYLQATHPSSPDRRPNLNTHAPVLQVCEAVRFQGDDLPPNHTPFSHPTTNLNLHAYALCNCKAWI